MSSLNDVYPHKTNSYVGGWKSWKKPSAYVDGSWKDGKEAWVFKDGAWVHVWSSVAAGTFPKAPVATVSNEGVDSNVKVAWDAVPQANSYDVYNVDGTAVTGTGGTTAKVFTDTNPQDGKAGYKVKANLPGDYGSTESTSNILTLAQAPSSLTAAAPTNGDDVALSWSVVGCGHHDQIQVVRGGASLAYLARGVTSYTDTNARQGTVESYKVRAVISGNHGPYSNTATSSIPAKVPTSVKAVATTTKGQLKLTWVNPTGHNTNTGYQVQANDGGWVNTGSDESPSYYTFTGSGSKSMRVRALSEGGSSSYVTASATPVWLYAPNVPKSVSIASTTTQGQLKLSWSAPTTDTSHDAAASYVVETSTDDKTWTDRGPQTSPYSYTFTGSSGDRYMRVKAINNAGSSAWVKKSTAPLWAKPTPSAPSVSLFAPDTGYGKMHITFKTSSANNHEYRVAHRINSGSWVYGSWVSVSNNSTKKVNVVNHSDSTDKIYCFVDVRNSTGQSSRSVVADYTLRRYNWNMGAQACSHWQVRTGMGPNHGSFQWVSSLANNSVQGYFDSQSKRYHGIWTYGYNTIKNAHTARGSHCGATVTIESAYFLASRRTGGTYQSTNVWLGGHGHTSIPPKDQVWEAPVTGAENVGQISIGAGPDHHKWVPIPLNVRNKLVAGTFHGLGVCKDSGGSNNERNYAVYNSLAEDGASGMITFYCWG